MMFYSWYLITPQVGLLTSQVTFLTSRVINVTLEVRKVKKRTLKNERSYIDFN